MLPSLLSQITIAGFFTLLFSNSTNILRILCIAFLLVELRHNTAVGSFLILANNGFNDGTENPSEKQSSIIKLMREDPIQFFSIYLSLIHISEPTRLLSISYAV